MNSQATIEEIPAGYVKDREGHLVPKSKIKPIDSDRDKVVNNLVIKANRVSGIIADFKEEALAAVADRQGFD